MGLIDSLLRRRTGTQLAQSSSDGTMMGVVRIGGANYSARWNFTRILDSVYANPTARRCVERIANDFSRPDWQLRKMGTEDDLDPSDPRYDLFRRPNGVTSGTAMQYHISRDLDLSGGTIWLKMRGNLADPYTGKGQLIGLRRLAPQRVTVIADADDVLIGFVYQDRYGRPAPLLPEEVVYVNFPHPERPADRMAPALVAGLPAETDTAAMRFNFELLSNDSALPGYLVVEGLTPKGFGEWAAQWQSGDAPGKTRFLNGSNAKYVKVGQSNQELTYDKLRDASREDICRSFGPPRVLIDPTDATFANMDVATRSYMTATVLPRWTLVGDAFSLQLADDIDGLEVGFKLDDIEELQEGLDGVVARSVQLLDRQTMTPNEVRAVLGLKPVPWGDEPIKKAAPPQLNPAPNNNQPDNPDNPDANDPAKSPLIIDVKVLDDLDAELKMLTAGETKGVSVDIETRVERQERRTKAAMGRFFDKQGKAIAARIRSKKSLGKTVDPSIDWWWDEERWNTEVAEVMSPILADSVESIGSLALNTFSADSEFDAATDKITNYLATRSQTIAALVNGTTHDDVRSVIADISAEGGSISDMADAISGYFTDQGDMRAERVARTEMIGAANYAQVEAARQSGVVSGKTWLAASDAEQDCAELDGTTVGLDEGFGEVDEPPLHPNCRCTLTFTINGDTTEGDDSE